MSKKTILISAFVLVALLFLGACSRAATKPPAATPTGAQQIANTPVATTGMSLMAEWGTSTVIYQQTLVAQGTVFPPTQTPTPNATTGAFTLVPPTGAPTSTLQPGALPIVTVAPLARPSTYTLQSGEFLYCIARRYNLDQDELLSLNGLSLSQASSLPVGYILKIPQTGNPFVGTRALLPHPAQYTIAVDDTIYRIACHYGDVDPAAIAASNGLAAPYLLTTGRVLNIP